MKIIYTLRLLEIDLSKANSGRWKDEIGPLAYNSCNLRLEQIFTHFPGEFL